MPTITGSAARAESFRFVPVAPDTPRNVDALGKAYIIDRAAAAARKAWPSIDALLLNIGGDIVVWGRSCEIGIADPGAWYDNARPIATIDLQNAAVATSGTYARGAHLIDPRSGTIAGTSVAATVVASDAVTANALATTLCLTSAEIGLQLVESTPGAEALRVESGVLQRTSGFARLERPFQAQPPRRHSGPPGYQRHADASAHGTPFLETSLCWPCGWRTLQASWFASWRSGATKSKYYSSLSTLWDRLHGNFNQLRSVTRATRPAGQYDLVWDGLDNDGKPVPLGTYRITVETNQEHGTYAKQTGTISLGDSPTSITLPATTNFDAVVSAVRSHVEP